MPTYGFKCPAGHEFDKFYRKMSDSVSELPCPTCGEPAARQLHGGAGLVFKGSGFYLTDYGKNAHRTGTDGKAAAESSSGGSEKKPASGGEKSAPAAPPATPAATPPKSSGSSGSSGAA